MVTKHKKLTLDDRLGLIKRVFGRESHIQVDQEKFKEDPSKTVLFICPAKVYTLHEKTNECVVNFENCIECGTCQVACPEYVNWRNPHGACGISYKYG